MKVFVMPLGGVFPAGSPDWGVKSCTIWSPAVTDAAPHLFCTSNPKELVSIKQVGDTYVLRLTHHQPDTITKWIMEREAEIVDSLAGVALDSGTTYVYDLHKKRIVFFEDFKYTSPSTELGCTFISRDSRTQAVLTDPVPFVNIIAFRKEDAPERAVFTAMCASANVFRTPDNVKTAFGKHLAVYLYDAFLHDGIKESLNLGKVGINEYFSFPTASSDKIDNWNNKLNFTLLDTITEKVKTLVLKAQKEEVKNLKSKPETETKPKPVETPFDADIDIETPFDDDNTVFVRLSEIIKEYGKYVSELDANKYVHVNPDSVPNAIDSMYIVQGVTWICPKKGQEKFDFAGLLGIDVSKICLVFG